GVKCGPCRAICLPWVGALAALCGAPFQKAISALPRLTGARHALRPVYLACRGGSADFMSESDAKTARGWALLMANRDFWRLWLVGLVVFVVRWLEMLAMAVFVYQRTGSAFLVALLTMLRLLPMARLGAFLGVFADRLERRSALILTVSAQLTTSLVLAFLAYSDELAVWHLATASFLNGIGWAADNPVRRVMIGEAVGIRGLGTAMSVGVGPNKASRMLGPTTGGILLAGFGMVGVFAVSVALLLAAL